MLTSLLFSKWCISAITDSGEDPEVIRAKYFIRDEFLVSDLVIFIIFQHIETLRHDLDDFTGLPIGKNRSLKFSYCLLIRLREYLAFSSSNIYIERIKARSHLPNEKNIFNPKQKHQNNWSPFSHNSTNHIYIIFTSLCARTISCALCIMSTV